MSEVTEEARGEVTSHKSHSKIQNNKNGVEIL